MWTYLTKSLCTQNMDLIISCMPHHPIFTMIYVHNISTCTRMFLASATLNVDFCFLASDTLNFHVCSIYEKILRMTDRKNHQKQQKVNWLCLISLKRKTILLAIHCYHTKEYRCFSRLKAIKKMWVKSNTLLNHVLEYHYSLSCRASKTKDDKCF